ncbi:helix-turn-helix domain-containing protein [Pseudomonas sp. NY15181]|uniref:helix-turn-helix domain-containing protein n=1 Tax=Pseudomonas sp. NY15181 TaxID=3400349 RepID=UPI003A88416A
MSVIPTDLPTEREIAAAIESSRHLAAFISSEAQVQRIAMVSESGERQMLEVPTFALRAFREVLSEMALGNSVRVAPIRAELNTQEGAALLGVSRRYLMRLLEDGVIPSMTSGGHRRVRLTDLLAYQKRCDANGRSAMDELAAQAQELDLGYD